MAGRKPTPTALKLLRGNPGKRALPKREPTPAVGLPPCPAHLTPIGKRAWRKLGAQLVAIRVMTAADARALELLCETYDLYRQARKALNMHGLTYETMGMGGLMIRARPEVAIASNARKQVAALLRDFGLTPSSRSKVSTTWDDAADPLDQLLGA